MAFNDIVRSLSTKLICNRSEDNTTNRLMNTCDDNAPQTKQEKGEEQKKKHALKLFI